ncbi:hypothetical protein OY671_009370, partial [Metschnikowia pulcherrima]
MASHKDNVFIDLSGWSPKYFAPQIIQYANTQSRKKMSFGSDFPSIHPQKWIEAASKVGFKEEVSPGIMKDNATRRLDAEITTSGRIEDKDVGRSAASGVRHVVNLASETRPEASADEGAKSTGQGIAYTHIPVPFDAPGEDHFAAFRKAVEEGPRPVHVHCIMNWRVSAFLYRSNRD